MSWTLRPGAILLEKYRIESVLGRGGMGVVLKVSHLHLGEKLALKILSPEAAATPDITARFLREAQSVVRLRGEHVTRVHDVGLFPNGAPYMVMEYLRGIDLAGEIQRRRMLPPGEAVDYVLQACEALAEAHAHRIIHRDIKPANLFLTTRPDGTPLVKVLDFGISKAPVTASHLLTKTETVMGTPSYMSPEQMKASRDVDARTDIWSLGIVLYECLCGRRPFEGESFSAVVLLVGTEPPPPMDPRVPRGLQAIVLRCLEKDRKARFPSVAALTAALAPFARDQRAAALVVDRANLMLQGTQGGLQPVVRSDPPPAPTTLSGSAGFARQTSRRRHAFVGALSLLGSIAVLAAVTLRGAGSSQRSREESGIAPDTHVAGRSASEPLATPSSTANAELQPPTTPTLDVTTSPPSNTDTEKAHTLGRCTELAAQKAWTALAGCASELTALGLNDKARDFHAMAKRESGNKAQADKIQQTIRDGDLKKAQALLPTIHETSVYYASSLEAFSKAEAQAFNDATRTAQDLANTHDCPALKQFIVQLVAISTDRVVTAARAVKCTDKAPSANPTATKAPVTGDKESTWSTDSPFMPMASNAPKTTTDDKFSSPTASTAAKTQAGRGDAQPATSPTPTETKNPCDAMNVDGILEQAAKQFIAGYANSALKLVTLALVCKQDVTMYRKAGLYACAAHDLPAAKRYFTKIPVSAQAGIEQKCQLEGLDVRAP